MKINENIKNFRTFRGIKQQDLADMLGKSKSVISNWERGENSPDVESCEKMCKILQVTPNELFGWEENREYLNYLDRMVRYAGELDKLKHQMEEIQGRINYIEKARKEAQFHDDSEE